MKKNILEDIVAEGSRSILTARALPVIVLILVGSSFSISMIYLKSCYGNSHLKQARKLFETGDFQAAATEADTCIQEEPDTLVCMDMLADAHAAMVMSAPDQETRMMHACTALKTYAKRLDKLYNNNVAARMHVLAQRFEMSVEKGVIYGGCTEGQTQSPIQAP